ncbi:putative sugar phosphate/phosphate translocator [Hibiscus syriacus]|uniref:Sugar phosphate/phosphate translocator n=1 Tax=Hibiscus syriacus TaxID=106335 RepID=A0A6A2Z9J1_HIBSY|nr:putative sugar phosphate/phosphate translocator [Hibiscus syriacus]
MGKGGSLSNSVLRNILFSYAYVAIWIFLSFSVIVYNKYILDKKMYNWPFPISLTLIHMSFCSTLAFLLIKVFRFVDPVSMSRDLYLSSVVPIGALYSLSLWLSNSAYIYLSVSFIQMLKALMPVAVYSIGVLFKKETFKPIRWPTCCPYPSGSPLLLTTSALTMNVAGVVKDWLLIAFSWSVIKDMVTPINLFGYGLAFLGVAYYNHSKLQALKAKEAQKTTAQTDDEAGRLLKTTDGEETGSRN